MALPEFLTSPDPDVYFNGDYIVFDLETTNLHKGAAVVPDNELVVVGWYDSRTGETQSVRCNEYTLPADLVDSMESADFVVAHNAKFDLQWMARAGLDLSKVLVFDTQIAEYIIQGNKQLRLALDACAKRYNLGGKGDTIKRLMSAGVCPSQMPSSLLRKYNVVDVDLCHELFLIQRAILQEQEKLKVFYSRCLVTPVLADIEFQGMCLDADRVNLVTQKVTAELVEIQQQFIKLYGDVNMGSPDQRAVLLFDTLKFAPPKDWRGNPLLTPKGKISTSQDALARLKAKTKKQREFLELYGKYSKLNALYTKTLKNAQACCNENDGILLAQFNQTVTKTGRLSSTGLVHSIQFQNFPRDFKPLFKARHDGWRIGEADQAQLEFRGAVFMAQDVQGMEDIVNKVDIHAFTSQTLTEAGQETNRQGAKEHTFKPLYGGKSGTDAERTYYEAFRKKYKQIDEMQQAWIREALFTGKVTTLTGMEFYFPDTQQLESGYVTNSTNICNYPVQMFATADIVPISLVFQWHKMRAAQLQSFIINTIHDSTITEVHPDEEVEYGRIVEEAFTEDVYQFFNDLYGIEINVPLEAEVKSSQHWNDNPTFVKEWLCQ